MLRCSADFGFLLKTINNVHDLCSDQIVVVARTRVRPIDRFEGFEAMALSERLITTSYLLSWLAADAAESTRRH